MTYRIRPAQSRRDFIRIVAGAMAAGALPATTRAQDAKFRRWEITDPAMPPSVLNSYKKGIREMLKRPATDPRNWYRHAFVHIFDCPHGNWWFLAWHRAYLGWLEQILRDLSGDAQFALPYWDWTKTPRIPAAMFDDVLDPNNAAFIASFDDFRSQFDAPMTALWGEWSAAQRAALARRGLNTPADFWNEAQQMFFDRPDARGLTAASPGLDSVTTVAVGIATIRAALQTTMFAGTGTGAAGFASARAPNHSDGSNKGILESQPHDNVHGAIGGPSGNAFMVSFLSPVDPIFFLHHGNLDRLWDVWNRRQTALNRPVLPQGADLTAWSGEKFLFFSDAQGQPVSKTNAGDYATIGSFAYDYSPGSGEDEVPPPAALVAALPPPRSFSAQITANSTAGGAAAGGIAQVPAAALRAGGAEASPQVAEVTLNLSPADQGRRFRILVSTGNGAAPIEAGGITVFSHHDHGPTTFTVPLPEEVRARATGAVNVPLDIRVVPLEQPAAGGPSVARTLSLRAARLHAAPPVQVSAITVRTN